MKGIAIYYLVDPRAPDKARYVGQSCETAVRYRVHCRDRRDSYKMRWIAKLRESGGLLPQMRVVAVVQDEAEAARVEKALIALWRRRICRHLTNGTAGGDGVVCPTPEAVEKRAAKLRGRKLTFSAAHRENLKAARQRLLATGWTFAHTAEAKQRIGAGAKGRSHPGLRGADSPMYGRHHSLETRTKISLSKTGVTLGPLSVAHRQKLSARAKQRPPMSIDVRARISQTLSLKQYAYRSTPEYRTKMRAAALRRWSGQTSASAASNLVTA